MPILKHGNLNTSLSAERFDNHYALNPRKVIFLGAIVLTYELGFIFTVAIYMGQ